MIDLRGIRVRYEEYRGHNLEYLDVISYTREGNICDSTEFIDIDVSDTTLIQFNTTPFIGDELRIYTPINLMVGLSVLASYRVDSITKNMDGTVHIHASNPQKDLLDTFVHETYAVEDYPELKTRYWIEKFFTDSAIEYEFTTTDPGEYLPEDDVLGNEPLYSIIQKLLEYSGWYLKYDEFGEAKIGKLDTTKVPIMTLDDSSIQEIKTVLDTKPLRNRVVVWGKGNPTTGNYVYADVSVNTPWNIDVNDKRTTLISNYHIPNNRTALSLASKALKLFAKPSYVKTITFISGGPISDILGENVTIKSGYFSGTGIVTSFSETLSENGLLTTLVLDQLCPRLVGVYTFNGYVYVGTQEDGIWRKNIEGGSQVWENFSTGMTDLSIKDLQIANGMFATVTNNGQAYYRTVGDASWTRYYPYLTTVESGIVHYWPAASGIAYACTVDPISSDVHFAFNLANTVSGWGETQNLYGGVYYTTEEGRSWVATLGGAGYNLIRNVSVSGYNNIAILDIDTDGNEVYITALSNQSAEGGETFGTIHHLPYENNCPTLFNSSKYITPSGTSETYYSGATQINLIHFSNTYLYGKFVVDTSIPGQVTYTITRDNYLLDIQDTSSLTIPTTGTPYILNDHVVIDDDTVVAFVSITSTKQFDVYEFSFATGEATKTATIDPPTWPEIPLEDIDTDRIVGVTKNEDEINIIISFAIWDIEMDLSLHSAFTVYHATEQRASNHFEYGPYTAGQDDYVVNVRPGADLGDHRFFFILASRGNIYPYLSYGVLLHTDSETSIINQFPCRSHEVYEEGDYFPDFYYRASYVVPDFENDCWWVAVDGGYYTVAAGHFDYYTFLYKIWHTGAIDNPVYFSGDLAQPTTQLNHGASSKNLAVIMYTRYKDATTREYAWYDLTHSKAMFQDTFVSGTLPILYSRFLDEYDNSIISVVKEAVSGHYHNVVRYNLTPSGDSYVLGSKETITSFTCEITSPGTQGLLGGGGVWLLGETILIKSGTKSAIKYITDLVPQESGNGVANALGGAPLLRYNKNGTFSKVTNYIDAGWHLDMSQDYPTILYGGDNIIYNTGTMTIYKNIPASGILPYLGYIATSGIIGDNYVRDVRTFSTLDETDGFRRRSAIITDTPYTNGGLHSYLRLLDYENLTITEDPFNNGYHFNNEWVEFSGMVKHLETTNMDVNPYYFVSTSGSPSKFYQKAIFDLGEDEPEWVEASTGLPNSEITIIRVDDNL